jgi:hypothetical protein
MTATVTSLLSQQVDSAASPVTALTDWFERTLPSPNYQDTHRQFSLLIEQQIALLVCLQEAGNTTHSRDEIGFSISVLDFLSRRFSAHTAGIEVDIKALDRISVIHALCQQLVSIVGIAHALELDLEGAVQELIKSNRSCLDQDGNPLFNLQRKLVPAPGFKVPDYTSYI